MLQRNVRVLLTLKGPRFDYVSVQSWSEIKQRNASGGEWSLKK